MASAGKKVEIRLDLARTYQKIDGFGVNINPKYWVDQRLLPAMDLLLDELGATIYRMDLWGKSNWIDPDSEIGAAALDKAHLESVYQNETFQRGWALMRYLNECGIEPYLSASGDVPTWMLAENGKTLQDYEAFTDMLVSLVEWTQRRADVHFSLFSPLNESNIGSPKGPTVSPGEFVKICELLDEKLTARELEEIHLVAPEQAGFNTDYLAELVSSQKLQKRLGIFAMHDSLDHPAESYRNVIQMVRNSLYHGRHVWISEFGHPDQSGEKEWFVAWEMVSQVMDHLAAGFNASLAWDAFDNFNEQAGSWTIHGLLRAGQGVFTPKKRFFALKQIFRFVLPGFERSEALSDHPDVQVLAFADPERSELTVIGMNLSSSRSYYLNIDSPAIPAGIRSTKVDYYRTSATENCALVERIPVRGPNAAFTGIEASIPPDSIFTFTTL